MENPFAPTIHSLSDTLLQIRAKPYLYLLLWLCLSLAPVVLVTQLLSPPIEAALTDFFNSISGSQASEPLNFPPGLMESFLKLMGLYGIVLGISTLINIYYGAVLAQTISRFRRQELPVFREVLLDGASQYIGFLKAVLYTAWLIFWKPTAAILVGNLLSGLLKQDIWSSVGLFVGVFLVFTHTYRYGLSPFIHLSLGLSGKEASLLSRAFYNKDRRIVSSLFLILILLPLLIFLLLFSLFMRAGIYMGIGSVILWLIQSLYQFVATMTMINFAMNSFSTK